MTIFDDIKKCRICHDTLQLGANPVVQGNESARILIAGQAPSKTVHQTNKPFNDASGTRLRAWLNVTERTFYDPSLFAIVPMAFCYPGKGSSGDLPPPPICAKTWRSQLLKQFSQVKLTIVIGQYAQQYHFPNFTSVTEQTSIWQSLLPSMIALPHPSPRNQHWLKKNPWFSNELLPELQKITHKVITKVK
ncbi:uracil-DNA glycosylase family protein [Pseudoalteromonas sp. MMG012]|uniref:uracil-DNA glycosylase family protein n=1 Tax=Pseudoalteromonas sp. MMG012 TaxID=2822686 RepID=UPI001B3A55E7|nr:uracil-DNA glycosylase family protein [Pseudoalteromonas sp. MMG012]MBQ4850364.1 uracil-DNA glycosylase family protein [Pseudoalteromonas sp. MMG012]